MPVRFVAAQIDNRSEDRIGSRATGLRCPRDVRLSRERTFRYGLLSNSGSLAMLAAMRRASCLPGEEKTAPTIPVRAVGIYFPNC